MRSKKTFDKNLEKLTKFCEDNKRLPKSKNPEESELCWFYRNNISNPYVRDIVDLCIRSSEDFMNKLNELSRFCKENNRLPNLHNSRDECKIYVFMNSYKDDDRIRRIKVEYKRSSNDKKKKI